MRNRIVLVLVLIVSFIGATLLFAQEKEGFKSGSEPDGFRGIKWGTNVNEIKDLEYIQTMKDGRKIYTRIEDKMQIGNAQLDTIWYSFLDDKFYSVFVSTKKGHCNELNAAVVSTFGEGYRTRFGETQYRGVITWADLICRADQGRLNLTSKKGQEQTHRDVKDDF